MASRRRFLAGFDAINALKNVANAAGSAVSPFGNVTNLKGTTANAKRIVTDALGNAANWQRIVINRQRTVVGALGNAIKTESHAGKIPGCAGKVLVDCGDATCHIGGKRVHGRALQIHPAAMPA